MQRDMNNICEEIRNQAALNDRLLTKARGEVQMAYDKRETAERFAANLEYGNAKTAERAQEQRFKVRRPHVIMHHLQQLVRNTTSRFEIVVVVLLSSPRRILVGNVLLLPGQADTCALAQSSRALT